MTRLEIIDGLLQKLYTRIEKIVVDKCEQHNLSDLMSALHVLLEQHREESGHVAMAPVQIYPQPYQYVPPPYVSPYPFWSSVTYTYGDTRNSLGVGSGCYCDASTDMKVT
jgi:hypothetical protein